MRLARLLLETQPEQARAHLEETLAWFEEFYGDSRPDLIEPLGLLALACSGGGDEAAARRYFRRALAIAANDGNGVLDVEGVSLSLETLDAELPNLYERVVDAQPNEMNEGERRDSNPRPSAWQAETRA
ncbi:MAG TPA: tetratricopeptide repeat protein [Solirubrobacterales bacterium]|jgi:hypothetical protein|nr:tetratricopeptide repeat protein [Solirubrobacterales bacterium]